ncbi:translocation/assembly module TamB domain-containing protein [Cellvibrio sp.]|uniref:translocation/assembly module TamB domain-containing protein n=1 Tax=Cellvibrio sp. TaxID=1965322 RepID=UPI00396480C4
MKLPRLNSFSRLKKYIVGFFLFLSIIIALLSSLMSTETGSHWVVRKAANKFEINLGELHGNLLSGLDISSFSYHKGDVAIQGEKLSFRWQPSGLLYTSVNIDSLSAEKIRINLPPSKKEPEPEHYEWPSLAQPVRIKLDGIDLRDIEFRQGETLVPLESITGSVGLGTLHLRAHDFSVANRQGKISLNGAMALRYPYDLDVKADWQLKLKSSAENNSASPLSVAGRLAIDGDLKTLKLKQVFSQPLNMTLTASISPALHERKTVPTANINLIWPEQNLPAEWMRYLDFANNQSLQIANKSPAKQVIKGTTKGQLNLNGWLDKFAISANLQANTNLNRLVVAGTSQAGYKEGENLFKAHFENLNLLVQSKSDSPVSGKEYEISNAVLLNGNLQGLTDWQWDVNLATEHLNLQQFIADWPSDLAASVKAKGSYNPGRKTEVSNGVELSLSEIKLLGDLRGLAVSASGQVEYDGAYWSSSDANLAIGANQVSLKGSTGDDLNLEWKIDAPLLGQIDPSIHGSIISAGKITGKKSEPRLNLKGQVNEFSWRDYAVNNLSLSLSPKADTQNYDLLLNAAHLQLAGQYISHFTVKGSGALAQHSIEAQLESPDLGAASLALDGKWQNEIWRGDLKALNLRAKKMSAWSLASSLPMQYNTQPAKKSAEFGNLCLTTKGITAETPLLCAQGQWNPISGLKLQANATAVPINQLQAWLKPEAVISGVIEGELNLLAPPNKSMVMETHLDTRDVQLLYQFQGGKAETYPLKKGSLDAAIKNDQLTTSLQMDWAPYGLVSADGKYSLKDKKIQGKLVASLNDLAPLESMLPFLNDVQGAASANMSIAGTAEKPELFGNISINNGSANLPKLGLVLHDASLKINAQRTGQVHVEGQVTSGEGALMVRGDLENLGTPQWSWQSNIYGANIRFIEQPQMTATLSPNLTLSANANAINLAGSTEIPWARAALKTLPATATRVSSDVVVIKNEQEFAAINAKKTIPFYTNVILYFGDDVRFKGFGLDTQLLGKVNVLKEEKRQTFVTGFVAVGKGNYKAYGQDLVIERGRLIFQGPYDNPGLDIRATRVLDEGMAGLEIGGTLQHPKSSVFAIPAATDSQAMAMLLTGKKLSESSQADAYSLIGAISSLGMDNGEGMTSDIAHFFHIDEITVKADKGLDQSELWMGKYITPKLFIRYIVGLFDQTFSLGVRYQLSEKLRLEAESGKNQSLDVIYKIER